MTNRPKQGPKSPKPIDSSRAIAPPAAAAKLRLQAQAQGAPNWNPTRELPSPTTAQRTIWNTNCQVRTVPTQRTPRHTLQDGRPQGPVSRSVHSLHSPTRQLAPYHTTTLPLSPFLFFSYFPCFFPPGIALICRQIRFPLRRDRQPVARHRPTPAPSLAAPRSSGVPGRTLDPEQQSPRRNAPRGVSRPSLRGAIAPRVQPP